MRANFHWVIYFVLCFSAASSLAGDKALDVATRGQFAHPSVYHEPPESRLASVIDRFQLSPRAYRQGIALLRDSHKREQSRLRWALMYRLKDMQIAESTKSSLLKQVNSIQATGRVLHVFDWDLISIKPEQNRMLQQGDVFIAPYRPITIQIAGAVKAQSVPFVAEQAVDQYRKDISYLPGADSSYIWVITPDTNVRRIGVSYWNTQTAYLSPGSILYIPLKGEKDFNQSMIQLYAAQVLPY